MRAESAPNYTYWQECGERWFNEYGRRKTFMLYFHIQEIFLAEYVSRYSPARVLDYGCGTGRHLRNLRQVPGIIVHGYDQSPTMVAGMKNWASAEWIEEHVHLGEPVGRLPFPDKAFDVAFTNEVLVHTRPDDLERILRELLRVTRSRIIHLEPGTETPLISDAHAGCWGHDLIVAYRHLGFEPNALPALFASQIPIEIRLDGRDDSPSPFPELTCSLFREMEAMLAPVLDRGMYEETLSRTGREKPVPAFPELFDASTGTLKVPTESLSREQLGFALSLLVSHFWDLNRSYNDALASARKQSRRITHLEDHVTYLEHRVQQPVELAGSCSDRSGFAIRGITIDILPDPNDAAQGNQVWIRYIKHAHDGPMMPWSAIDPAEGWHFVDADGCMYDRALLGENAQTLMLPDGDDPEINFMSHPWSGRVSLKWRQQEYIVDLYRPTATDVTVRLRELPPVTG